MNLLKYKYRWKNSKIKPIKFHYTGTKFIQNYSIISKFHIPKIISKKRKIHKYYTSHMKFAQNLITASIHRKIHKIRKIPSHMKLRTCILQRPWNAKKKKKETITSSTKFHPYRTHRKFHQNLIISKITSPI